MAPCGRTHASKGQKIAIWLFLLKCLLMHTDDFCEDSRVLQGLLCSNQSSSFYSLHAVLSQFGPEPSWYNNQLTNDHTQRRQWPILENARSKQPSLILSDTAQTSQ